MTAELKPCPFCLGTVRRFVGRIVHDDLDKSRSCIGPFNATDEQWNTRATDQRIAELEAECERLRDKNEVLANSVKAMEMRVMKFVNAHYTIEEKLQDNALKESER